MTDTEPINIQKWMIAAVCFLCVICFGLGCFVGYSVANNQLKEAIEPTVTNIVDESTSMEETTEETTIETTEPDITEVTEATEVTEPIATEYIEPQPEYTEIDPNSGLSDLEMLGIVIFQETGGDENCDDCRRRVADIVLNRVASDKFPNTIYDVLTEEGQYGTLHYTGVVWADRVSNPTEAHAVDRAWRIAEEVLNGQHSDVYGQGYVWQAGFEQGTSGFWCCGHFFGR